MYSLVYSTQRLEALTSQCHRDESVSKRESITSLSLSLLMYETLSITLALQHQLKSEEITSVVTVTACSPLQHALQHRSPGPSPVPSPASNPTPLVPPARTSRATAACGAGQHRQPEMDRLSAWLHVHWQMAQKRAFSGAAASLTSGAW